MSERVVPSLLWGAAALTIAAIVHLASILIVPQVAPDDAFARLARQTRPTRLELLPKPDDGPNTIPFRDPALTTAVCRYDLREARLRIGVALGNAAFLAVSFHSRRGLAFYALTNRSGDDGRIDLVLLTPAQLEKAEAADSEDAPVHDVRVTAPEPEGFVEFDILPQVGGDADARRILMSAGCQLELDP